MPHYILCVYGVLLKINVSLYAKFVALLVLIFISPILTHCFICVFVAPFIEILDPLAKLSL